MFIGIDLTIRRRQASAPARIERVLSNNKMVENLPLVTLPLSRFISGSHHRQLSIPGNVRVSGTHLHQHNLYSKIKYVVTYITSDQIRCDLYNLRSNTL